MDAKALNKTLAKKTEKSKKKIIDHDQNGFIPRIQTGLTSKNQSL